MTLKIPNWMMRLSDWIDEKFFPLPSKQQQLDMLHEQQAKVEQEAIFIRRQIRLCDTIPQCENVGRMIDNMSKIHGNTTQVCCWQDSLRGQIHNRKIKLSK